MSMLRRVNNFRRPTQSPFQPSRISGNVLWLNSGVGITLATGVSSWLDQSGRGRNATQGTGASQPTYNASDAAFNGHASLSFNGTSNVMSLAGLSPLVAPCTVFFVGLSNGAAQGTILEDANVTEFISSATNIYEIYAGSALVASLASNAATVVAAIFNGASSVIYQNLSTTAATSGTTGAGAVGGVAAALGASTASSNFFTGKIVEIAAYNTAFSSAQVGQWFRYAGNKYGKTWG